MPPCLTLKIIRYGSRVSGAIQGKELHPPLHVSVVANEKEAFGSPSMTVANCTFLLYMLIQIDGLIDWFLRHVNPSKIILC